MSGTITVGAGGYTLEVEVVGTDCAEVRLIGHPTQDSQYQEFTFGPVAPDWDGPDPLDNSGDDSDGDSLDIDDVGMDKVIVRSNNGAVSAEFQFTTDSIDGCHVAGLAASNV